MVCPITYSDHNNRRHKCTYLYDRDVVSVTIGYSVTQDFLFMALTTCSTSSSNVKIMKPSNMIW